MSRARVAETSVGDLGRALDSGSRTCSTRSLIAVLSESSRGCQPSERSRVPSTEEGAAAAAPKAKIAANTVTNSTIANTIAIGSDLNTNNFSDQQVADRLQNNSRGDQRVAKGVGEQRGHESRVHHRHHHHDDWGQGHQQ